MKKRVFISFSANDLSYMRRLKSHLKTSEYLEPIVITEKREAGKLNTEKVAEGIRSCDFIIPILTMKSINSQWVNQEIGYATALNKEILPIIEDNCLDILKGFIHKEKDQPYRFRAHDNPKTERKNFRACINDLISDLESRFIPIIISEIKENELSYLLRGRLINIDNKSRSLIVDRTIHHLEDSDSYDFLAKNKVKRDDNRITVPTGTEVLGRTIRYK